MMIFFVDFKVQFCYFEGLIWWCIDIVLEYGQFIFGFEVYEFEEILCIFVGSCCVIGVVSGIDVLQILMMVYGVGLGDVVFVFMFIFMVMVEVLLLFGVSFVFVDVEEDLFNLLIVYFCQCIEEIFVEGCLCLWVIVVVDFFGLLVDYVFLYEIVEEYDFIFMVDVVQSFGGSFDGWWVGFFVLIIMMSFFFVKLLGGYGDGGVVFIDDEEFDDVMCLICMYGKGDDCYDIVCVGMNGRFDILQVVIFLSKFEVFEEEFDVCEVFVDCYDVVLSDVVCMLVCLIGCCFVWVQYMLQVEYCDVVCECLSEKGIFMVVYYLLLMYLQSVYCVYGKGEGLCLVSEVFLQCVFSLLMYFYQSDDVMDCICEEVWEVVFQGFVEKFLLVFSLGVVG